MSETDCNYHCPCVKKVVLAFWRARKNVTDNGTHLTGSEFRNFCRSLSVENVTTPPYHSNRQAERFIDTFKRTLKKNNGLDTEESSIQQFLGGHRITPNPNTISGKSPAELMFSQKSRSVYDRLLLVRKKITQITNFKNTKYTPKYIRPGDKQFLKMYCGAKKFWEEGVISKRVGGMIC